VQADCFAEYLRCSQENPTGALAEDLVCSASLISCMNAHLFGSLGEHLVERPGEADVTAKAFLETSLVVKVLERHSDAVQAYGTRARSLGTAAPALEQTPVKDLAGDLDKFVQTIIQELQDRHHSD
jgi:hypothetical protein